MLLSMPLAPSFGYPLSHEPEQLPHLGVHTLLDHAEDGTGVLLAESLTRNTAFAFIRLSLPLAHAHGAIMGAPGTDDTGRPA